MTRETRRSLWPLQSDHRKRVIERLWHEIDQALDLPLGVKGTICGALYDAFDAGKKS